MRRRDRATARGLERGSSAPSSSISASVAGSGWLRATISAPDGGGSSKAMRTVPSRPRAASRSAHGRRQRIQVRAHGADFSGSSAASRRLIARSTKRRT